MDDVTARAGGDRKGAPRAATIIRPKDPALRTSARSATGYTVKLIVTPNWAPVAGSAATTTCWHFVECWSLAGVGSGPRSWWPWQCFRGASYSADRRASGDEQPKKTQLSSHHSEHSTPTTIAIAAAIASELLP